MSVFNPRARSSSLRALALFAVVCASAPSQAEDALVSSVAPYSAHQSVVPVMTCSQPKLPERLSTAPQDRQHLIELVNVYIRCVKEYVDARQAAAGRHNEMIKAEVEAGNAAVREVNEFRARLLALEDKHQPKE